MNLILAFLVSVFSLVPVAVASGYKVTPGDSDVSFRAIGKPSFLSIDGKGGHVTGGSADGKHGVFTVALAELTTDLSLRDHHMRDKYLEVGKYPTAELQVELPPLPTVVTTSGFTGKLTLHGVTKDVAGKVNLVPVTGGVRVEADFAVDLSSFGIDVPSFKGVTVADSIQVHVAFKAEKS